MNVKTYVIVTLRVEGLHWWMEAATECPESEFLRHTHRHMFHIKAKKLAMHDDRDIEIIQLKRRINDYLREVYPVENGKVIFRSKSCEMIAKDILLEFKLASCEVLEDGENGAIVESDDTTA